MDIYQQRTELLKILFNPYAIAYDLFPFCIASVSYSISRLCAYIHQASHGYDYLDTPYYNTHQDNLRRKENICVMLATIAGLCLGYYIRK